MGYSWIGDAVESATCDANLTDRRRRPADGPHMHLVLDNVPART